jgi:hypothetical protein
VKFRSYYAPRDVSNHTRSGAAMPKPGGNVSLWHFDLFLPETLKGGWRIGRPTFAMTGRLGETRRQRSLVSLARAAIEYLSDFRG